MSSTSAELLARRQEALTAHWETIQAIGAAAQAFNTSIAEPVMKSRVHVRHTEDGLTDPGVRQIWRTVLNIIPEVGPYTEPNAELGRISPPFYTQGDGRITAPHDPLWHPNVALQTDVCLEDRPDSDTPVLVGKWRAWGVLSTQMGPLARVLIPDVRVRKEHNQDLWGSPNVLLEVPLGPGQGLTSPQIAAVYAALTPNVINHAQYAPLGGASQ